MFPLGWDGLNGPLFDWYRELSCQQINRLQIRKDSSGAVPHRFIVAHLIDHSIQRFDRRLKSKNSGEIGIISLLKTSTIETVDEIEMVEPSTRPSLEAQTKCEVDLYLAGDMSILAILSACYGISRDDYAHNYALLRYNCYFFSWTILAIVSRLKIPNSIPQTPQVFARIEPRLEALTVTLANGLSQAVIGMVLDTVTAFNRGVGYMTLMRGSSWIDTVIWSMPMRFLRFVMRNMMKFRLHPNLIPHIQKQLFSELVPKLKLMLESKLHAHPIPANLHNSLWLSEVQGVVERAIRAETTNTVWDVMWDTLGGAGSDINVFEVARDVSQARIDEGHGGNEAQFSAIWNAALYAALPAVRRSAHGRVPDGTTTRETIFDDAWCSARDSALEAAQGVVRATAAKLNNKTRDVLWEKVWAVWNQTWEVSQGRARQSVLSSVNTMANALVHSVVEAVLLEIGGPHLRIAPVTVNVEDEATSVPSSNMHMTHAELQDLIQKLIRESSREQDSHSIATAMGRVWKISRSALIPEPTMEYDAPK
ncbi:hypothetical protein FRC06_006516 [Ceratobasidium sp. 370]|nr:hypothetical protein FRC06_006516 [Ceratobasidium sp. 370]